MDRNALDWIFSTLPQALAALSGLVFAGASFLISHFDARAKSDDSLTEIMQTLEGIIHKSASYLFKTSCLVIVLDIIAIFLNPIRDGWTFSFGGSWDWYYFFAILLFILNVFSLAYTIKFVLTVLDPNLLDKAIGKVKDNYQINHNSESKHVDGIEYLRLFQEFENGIRKKVNEETNNFVENNKMTTYQIIQFLYKNRVINSSTYKDLLDLNGIRNILVHGSIDENIPINRYNKLKELSAAYKDWPQIKW